MIVYPKSAPEKLGFDVLARRIEGHVRSRLGQERLEQWRPVDDLETLQDMLRRTAEMQDALRFDDAVPLDGILDVREPLRRARPKKAVLPGEDLAAVGVVLNTIQRLRQYVDARRSKYPALYTVAVELQPAPDLAGRIERAIDERGEVMDSASPELRRLRKEIVRRQNSLRDSVLGALRKAVSQGYATEEQPTIRNGRMVIPVRAEAKRKVQGFVHDSSATGQTVYIEPAVSLDLNNEVRELEIAERHEVQRILGALTAGVRTHADALLVSLDVLGHIDLIQAKARIGAQTDALVPDLNTAGRLSINEGRNPVLALHFQELNESASNRDSQAAPRSKPREVTPLDLELGTDYHALVITGPNAGGKSVAMKTAGLFCLMVRYGLPIPCRPGTSIPLVDKLFVDIGDEQSIEDDLSTFSSHVVRLRHMVKHADANTLILIDEAGTGTDPEEGGALAQAALEAFAEVDARVIVTTHHGGLKAFAHETPAVENGSMQFDPDTLSPTYRFQAGIPGSSYAFEIATRMKLPNPVVARARDLVGEQTSALEDLIAQFEARTAELERQLDESQRAEREAKQTQQKYEDLRQKLNENRDEIEAKALAQAEAIVKGANSRIERTVREIKEAEAEREATQLARERMEQFKQSVVNRKKKVDRKRTRTPKASKPKPKAQNGAPPRGPIEVGDQVVLDNGSATGKVMTIEGKEAEVAFGAMRSRVKLKRLTKVAGPRRQQVQIRTASSVSKGRPQLRGLRARPSIDVRGQRVDEAISSVTQLLDDAVVANLETVRILHGKGTGALRLAIQEHLAASPDVASFDEAHPEHGGAGVTEVRLLGA